MNYKLGVVPYLNALPLHWTLRDRDDIEIIREVPAKLAEGLESGRFDAALMPVIDHFRGAGAALLGDAIIGATGEVRSVLLFSKLEIKRIESVALDTSSHSSVALTNVILRQFYDLNPRFLNHEPNLHKMLERADAALLIGDPALEAAQNPGKFQVFDLALEWQRFTGLSFVFAAWTARKKLENRDELASILNRARDEGQTLIDEIVANNASSIGNSVVESYLREAINYRLTPSHRAGMELFRRRALS